MLISDIMCCCTRNGTGVTPILILYNQDALTFEIAHKALRTFRAISPFLRTKYSNESLNLTHIGQSNSQALTKPQ